MKKIYIHFLTLLIFNCLTNVTFAQKDNPSKDYLYLKNGSTVTGSIVFKEKKKQGSIKLIGIDGETTTYSTSEADSFLLENNQKYVVKNLNTNPEEFAQPNKFVQILFVGEFSLLKSNGKYFIELENGDILNLNKKSNTSIVGGSKSTSKRHLNILSYLTAGECNLILKDDLKKVSLNDQSLTSYIVKYHECKETAYAKNLNSAPKFRMSILAQTGIVHTSSKSTPNSLPTTQNLENPFSPIFLLGTRLDFYRELPRASMDLLIGFSSQNNTINFMHDNPVDRVTGTSTYTRQVISAQWFINYSVVKSRAIDIYFGAGIINRVNFTKNQFMISDYHMKAEGITLVNEFEAVKISPTTFSPSLKLGAILLKNQNSRLSAELVIDYTPSQMTINLPRLVYFNSLNTGFMIGYSFRQMK
ncbi:hypothetical protein MM213_12875 [Belliella sp. R4-6]|uniref:Outer membrane protein beta-barrel domain-containing protein n=1 Tax=Belliella alkalica TaxID=1730871 RepID=A0ABS9VEM4_9BACT|nr:hypothetical protein [Belliella alkalica]MCH7414385.1 hypothetical protein [Belliella alkalica]